MRAFLQLGIPIWSSIHVGKNTKTLGTYWLVISAVIWRKAKEIAPTTPVVERKQSREWDCRHCGQRRQRGIKWITCRVFFVVGTAWAGDLSQSPQCLAWKVLSLERLEHSASWEPRRSCKSWERETFEGRRRYCISWGVCRLTAARLASFIETSGALRWRFSSAWLGECISSRCVWKRLRTSGVTQAPGLSAVSRARNVLFE